MPKIIATAEVTNDHDQYSSRIRINKHELLVDEPLNNGGADLAPAPGDYLCAALASCKAITLRMYAQRKKWKIDEIKVLPTLFWEKNQHQAIIHFFARSASKAILTMSSKKDYWLLPIPVHCTRC